MTERKFADEEVIKALECCGSKHTGNEGEYSCLRCPLNELNDCDCFDNILHDLSFDLINRKNAEIDRLRNTVKTDFLTVTEKLKFSQSEIGDIRTEAIKEFAEELKYYFNVDASANFDRWIDKKVKEMTEEQS